ncbi:MAG: hypothetical protein ACXABY_30770, partial [Candidatus Thorarchaeota archaeon]
MILTYNGIKLPIRHSMTTRYDEEVILADDGSYMFTKYTIAVQAVLSKDNIPLWRGSFAGLGRGGSPTDLMNVLRADLSTPRATLIFEDDTGDVLVASPNLGANSDDNNGPKPLGVSIRMFSPETFIVDFSVETSLRCQGQSSFGDRGGIIKNYWEARLTYDQDFYATVEISGQVITTNAVVGRDGPFEKIDPLSVVPRIFYPLQKNFVRQGFHYVVSRDLRTVNYSFTDRQVYIPPPYPCSRADGAYTESTSDGSHTVADVSLHLTAPADKKRSDVLIIATKIVLAYLGTYNKTTQKTELSGVVQSASMRFDMFSNDVRINVRLLKGSSDGKKENEEEETEPSENVILDPFGFGIKDKKTGEPIDLQVDIIRKLEFIGDRGLDEGPFGNLYLRFIHQRLSSAGSFGLICYEDLDKVDIQQRDQTQEEQQDEAKTTVEQSSGQLEKKQSKVNQNKDDHTDYRIETRYLQQNMRFGFPSTDTSDDSKAELEVIKVSSSYMIEVVDWQAERLAANPRIPDPETQDNNEILISTTHAPAAPRFTADMAGSVRAVRGRYVYLLKKPP